MRVYNEFRQPQDFSAKMKCIAKPGFFTLLCGKGFDRLQIEVVIQMKVIQILTMN